MKKSKTKEKPSNIPQEFMDLLKQMFPEPTNKKEKESIKIVPRVKK